MLLPAALQRIIFQGRRVVPSCIMQELQCGPIKENEQPVSRLSALPDIALASIVVRG